MEKNVKTVKKEIEDDVQEMKRYLMIMVQRN